MSKKFDWNWETTFSRGIGRDYDSRGSLPVDRGYWSGRKRSRPWRSYVGLTNQQAVEGLAYLQGGPPPWWLNVGYEGPVMANGHFFYNKPGPYG